MRVALLEKAWCPGLTYLPGGSLSNGAAAVCYGCKAKQTSAWPCTAACLSPFASVCIRLVSLSWSFPALGHMEMLNITAC